MTLWAVRGRVDTGDDLRSFAATVEAGTRLGAERAWRALASQHGTPWASVTTASPDNLEPCQVPPREGAFTE